MACRGVDVEAQERHGMAVRVEEQVWVRAEQKHEEQVWVRAEQKHEEQVRADPSSLTDYP